MADEDLPTDRRSPVGEPVIRGDEAITGERAERAVRFDPTDPESVTAAAETVRAFAEDPRTADNIDMLRGAAACAALVRAEGSYKAASERAGGPVTVPFIRKWARVHDLPRAIRIHVARGDIAPTAAKHIARVAGEARYQLAWTAIDNDLTVRQIRQVASDVNNGDTVEAALTSQGVTPGTLRTHLSPDTYRELRRRAALEAVEPAAVIESALRGYFE